MNENADIREDTGVCDVIESLAITGKPESTGVTTFVQEACTAVSAVDDKFSFTHYPVQPTLQDVKEYFSRPVCVVSGTIPSPRGRFWNLSVPFSSLITSWTNGLQKLNGAYGIRAKIVLTLQVSATPFHQGLVCLSGQYGLNPTLIGFYDRSTDSCTATNLPHVVLDLSSDTSVQLHFPFLYVTEYASVRASSDETNYAQFALNNLVVVPTIVGMGNPTYQLYIHFEDIELFGATPQSTNTIVLTAGRKLSPVTEEFENDSFPFSSALHAAGRAISFVAKGVPSISSIGGPVAWAFGKAAGVVRYFGYGKPAVQDPVMRIFRMDNVGEFNTDVATSSMVIAANASNTTSINTMVGSSDVDEMSLAYVTSRWSQIFVFDYNSSLPPGTVLYATPINMLAFWFRSTGGPNFNKIVSQTSTATSNSIQPSHLMFASSSFKQWRGGIKFRFTFAKTKMHAGRVMVTYNPYSRTTTNTTLMSSATSVDIAAYGTHGPDPFGYSAVFDLKDGNVFEFKVPYVHPTPYANLAATIGALAMYVVNPLIASSVVSSTISCVVEVAGDSDFELANPTGIMFPVHNAGTIQLNAGRVLSEAPEIINQLTMGESITSVKQLISIPVVSATNAATPISNVIPPWYYQPTPSVLTPSAGLPPPFFSFSYGGNWASCYAFLKGGTDVHVYTSDDNLLQSIVQLPESGSYVPVTTTPDNRSFANSPTLITGRGALHARLPGFFPTARVNSWIANVLTGPAALWSPNPYSSGTVVTPYVGIQALYVHTAEPATPTDTLYFNRCASDDAQLAHYIGPPPVFLPAANNPGSFDVDGGVNIAFT
nr:MAG: hypothetical protein 2 [Weivirus-like virus sp.]QJI53765.1 MAG: hypothetical protein 2 [Weivirus-like virus sp.]